jgi:hypothetical protein
LSAQPLTPIESFGPVFAVGALTVVAAAALPSTLPNPFVTESTPQARAMSATKPARLITSLLLADLAGYDPCEPLGPHQLRIDGSKTL